MNPYGRMRVERRKLPRFQLELPVFLGPAAKGKPKDSRPRGTITDLSAGGIRVLSDKAYQEGDVVDVEMATPRGLGRLSGRAEVVWVKASEKAQMGASVGYVMGLRFQSIHDESRTTLTRVLVEKLKEMSSLGP